MDRTRRTDAGRARGRRVAGLMLVITAACHDLTVDPGKVVVLEVVNSTPRVTAGDTLRMVARALNVQGQPVPGAAITWSLLASTASFARIDPSGLITGI